MKNLIIFPLRLILFLVISALAWGTIDTYDFDTAEQRLRFQEFTQTMRCPKCQNQNLADSDAPIAKDLRGVLYELVQSDKSDDEVIDFMVSRYGEFVLYEPRLKGATWMLWFGPFLLLSIGFGVIVLLVRSRSSRDTVSGSSEAVLEASSSASTLNDSLSEQEQSKLQVLLYKKDS